MAPQVIPPGPHGGDGARVAAALGVDPSVVLDLSQSLNPCAPDVPALAARHLQSLRRYPDATTATAALAGALGVDAERVVLTNGGAEAIALVAAEVGAGWVEEPEFSTYRRHLPIVDPSAPRWRSNPNNPTGRLAAATDAAGVWDEAFFALATGAWTRGDADQGAWVVGSLTKVFACPGLRAGYVVAPSEDSAASVRARQPEWPLNGLAAALVPELVAAADLPGWAAGIAALRAELVAVLAGAGLVAEPSDACWVLVHAPGMRDRLLPHGVVVRDCASFGLDGWMRVAVPTEDGIARFANALKGTT